ncbi:MAG: SDR family oxidoreductase [Clostridiales Family XIII bacterium]|jgi:NAD(P)-dependent dehydrogenase (short-subunit alcohol dehydrogenase family)|nr:SDR family oxidoreductase [Clostridiales Family XIII bacterium]
MSEYFKTTPIANMTGAYDVKGKNVVVTGGNRGIGRGISTAFAQSGANVVILCRNYESGKAAVDDFAQYGNRYDCYQCDISDLESVKAAAKKVFEFYDHVDVLVNNAGVATTTDFLDPDKGLSEWHRIIDTNLHGVANVISEIAPSMKAAGLGGEIINISSVGGVRVSGSKDHHNSPYNASKAGVDIFSRYLAVTLGDHGIRVNSIQPGPIHSDLDKDLPPSFIQAIEHELPVHRFGEPIEIGALCVYLSSPAGAMITGVNLPMDGGLLTVH